MKNFEDYVNLYTKKHEIDDEPLKITYESPNPQWEVAVALSDSGFKQVSFVNSIATTKVNYFKILDDKHLIISTHQCFVLFIGRPSC